MYSSSSQQAARNIALLKRKVNSNFHFCKYDCSLSSKQCMQKEFTIVLGTFNNCFDIIMVNTFVAVYCKTRYKKRQHKIHAIPEKFSVFLFP